MKKYKHILFIILLSIISLMIVSKNSFLYCFNDWVDINSYMTVARGWMNGLLPYKDLFEQKGPLLYIMYIIANLISYKSFVGVYILEVISYSIFLYYIYKIFSKYISAKLSLISLLLFSSLILSSCAFYSGGSAEEFILPLLSIILYKFINFLNTKEISIKDLFISGILTGLIFNIKFNLIGFSFMFMAVIDFYYLFKKDIKKCIKYSLIFLLGMFLPIIIFVLYFLFNNGLNEYIDAYILYNSTTYGVKINIIKRVGYIIYFLAHGLYKNYFLIPFYLISLYVMIFNNKIFKDFISKIGIILFIASGCFFIYFNARSYYYYFLPIEIFSIFGIIFIFMILEKKLKNKYMNYMFLIVIIISSILLSTSKNISFMNTKKEDLVQYKYAKIINETNDAKLLNYGFLDGGFYYAADVLPINRLFHQLNGLSDEMNEEILYTIKNMEYDYIVYCSKDNSSDKIFNGYKIVKEDYQYYKNIKYYYYLYKKQSI